MSQSKTVQDMLNECCSKLDSGEYHCTGHSLYISCMYTYIMFDTEFSECIVPGRFWAVFQFSHMPQLCTEVNQGASISVPFKRPHQ